MIALDTETTGTDPWHGCRPFAVSICTDQGNLYYWEWEVDPLTREVAYLPQDLKEIANLCRDQVVFHNARFDLRFLIASEAFEEVHVHWPSVEDTLLASHVLDNRESHGLKDLALKYLDHPDDDEYELQQAVIKARHIGKRLGWRIANKGDAHFPGVKQASWWKYDLWLLRAVCLHAQEELPDLRGTDKLSKYLRTKNKHDHPWWSLCKTYAVGDAERTMALWLVLREALEEEGLLHLYKDRKRQLRAIFSMESRGISFSQRRWAKLRTEFSHNRDRCLQSLHEVYPELNVNSPQQLQKILHKDLQLKVIGKTEGGAPSTDAATIAKHLEGLEEGSPAWLFLSNLLGYRKHSKAVDYLQSYQTFSVPSRYNFSRLHPNINPTGTDTTRASGSNPNPQNISKQGDHNLRYLFGPEPGRVWYAIDYENIELRIFAYSSGDQRLIDLFESGESAHLAFAEILWPREFSKHPGKEFKREYKDTLYQWVKNGNFALIYGAFPGTANSTYHHPKAYDLIRKEMPLVDDFLERMVALGKFQGYVETLGGYRLWVDDSSPHRLRSTSCNYFIQGSAGWYKTLATCYCHEYLTDSRLSDHHLIVDVHDELVFDFPSNHLLNVLQSIKRLMELPGEELGIPVPVEVDRIETNWAEGKLVTP